MGKTGKLFTLEVVGAKEISRKLQRPIQKPVNPGLSKSAKAVAKAVRDAAPRRTGKLRAGHVARKTGSMGYLITDKMFYGGIVREGSPPHIIRPRRKKALYWPGLTYPVNMVNHPGFKANPYHEEGLRSAQGPIDKQLGLMGGAVVKEWTR